MSLGLCISLTDMVVLPRSSGLIWQPSTVKKEKHKTASLLKVVSSDWTQRNNRLSYKGCFLFY